MKCFCKGAIVGMIAGSIVTAVAISKDKNFYNMVKDKVDIASKKVSKFTENMKKKIENKIKENKEKQEKKEQIHDEIQTTLEQTENYNPCCGNNCNC